MHLSFVLADALDVPSPDPGAVPRRYDHALIASLRAHGHQVEIMPPCPIDSIAAEARVIVDRSALVAMASQADAMAARGIVALIHEPLAEFDERGPVVDDAGGAARHDIEAALLRGCARVVAASQTSADLLTSEFGVPADSVAIVTPGTPDLPRSVGSGSATCAILSIGELIPRKGHEMLLRALARLFDLDWHLTIVGDAGRHPVHAQTIAALVEQLAISQHVTFADGTAADQLAALWHNADLFALASRHEAHTMAVAEAFKRGVPVAVTSGGAAGALVTPDVGTACGIAERDTYSKSLRRMIFDRKLRHDMAEASWRLGQGLPDWSAQSTVFLEALAR